MRIQDIGSIGELIAAMTMEYTGLVGSSKENSSVFRRGLAEFESLDADEETQFGMIVSMMMQSQSTHDEYLLGIIDSLTLEASSKGVLVLLKTPGGQVYWAENYQDFTPEFGAYVDEKIEGWTTPSVTQHGGARYLPSKS